MKPAVSVVVSTFNRAHLLPRLVDALAAQDIASPFEVLIVDNGSSDDTASVLEELAAATPIDLRVFHIARNDGPAPARNLAWREARAPLIAFTDDDCVPSPGWLGALVVALQGADLAQGQTVPNPHQPYAGPFAWAPEATSEVGFYETCNIGYRRSVLDAHEGFDETVHRSWDGKGGGAGVWGDDTDLALRAKRAGATSVFVAEAVVWHDVKPGRLRDRLADLPRRRGLVLLLKRYPEQRDRYELPWFSSRAHAYLVGSALGALVIAARPRSLLGWLVVAVGMSKWARMRGVYYPRRQWPRFLPQWFVVDVTEIALFAQASAKHRTLFL